MVQAKAVECRSLTRPRGSRETSVAKPSPKTRQTSLPSTLRRQLVQLLPALLSGGGALTSAPNPRCTPPCPVPIERSMATTQQPDHQLGAEQKMGRSAETFFFFKAQVGI